MDKAVVYSAEWCGDCVRAKNFLKEHGIEFEERNIMAKPDLVEEVINYNIKAGFGPKRRIPVILLGDRILSEPTNDELAQALGITL